MWDIGLPIPWRVDTSRLVAEKFLALEQPYYEHKLRLELTYPPKLGYVGTPPANLDLNAWVGHELSFLPPERRQAVVLIPTTIAGAPAIQALNLPQLVADNGPTRQYSDQLTHVAYIWKDASHAQRVISIRRTDGSPNLAYMKEFLDEFLSRVRSSPETLQPPTTAEPSSVTLGLNWVRLMYASSWDIQYPSGWEIFTDGLPVSGSMHLHGQFEGAELKINLRYPRGLGFVNGPPADLNLNGWVEHELSFLSPEHRSRVVLKQITVANSPAIVAFNMPRQTYIDRNVRKYSDELTHIAYMWRDSQRNARTADIIQERGLVKPDLMGGLFEGFLARMR